MAPRRRRFGLFPGVFGDFERIEEMLEEMMRSGFEDIERIKEGKPLVYGFNIRIGPDGKPIIQQFGNVKPSIRGPRVRDEREPLVDVIEHERDVTVIAELPGVDKSRIRLSVAGEALTISVEGEYYKQVELPAAVNQKSAKATYKNGVLEVVLEKSEKHKPGETIKVE